MAALSQKAIEVLRKIHEQGLEVLWDVSHKQYVPRYGRTYETGIPVPYEDWNAFNKELIYRIHEGTPHHQLMSDYLLWINDPHTGLNGILFSYRLNEGSQKLIEE